MSSGLTAAKCPSCKIILLRPTYHSSSSSTARPTAGTQLHCPACRNQYSLRKGALLPAILLIPAACNSQILKNDGSRSAGCSPVPHRRRAGLVSPLAGCDATSVHSGSRSPRSPHRISKLPAALNVNDLSPMRYDNKQAHIMHHAHQVYDCYM
jgi:hypothetical protein